MAQTLNKIALAPDLIDKKSAAMKIAGSNLFLENRKIRIVPVKPYAALCAARENLDNSDLSQIVARLYDVVRNYFMENS